VTFTFGGGIGGVGAGEEIYTYPTLRLGSWKELNCG